MAAPQEQPPAYSLDNPLDTSDMGFLDEYEEQQEDPAELIAAAGAAGHSIDALEEALRLLNTYPTTADALVRADLRLIVARSAKQAAEEKRAFTRWTKEDERDLQLKKEVRAILSRY